ncbi:hypothetical protein GCM10028808_23010 [Spirosoma migulaei]
MAKVKTGKKVKPLEILELERIYYTIFNESRNVRDLDIPENTYILNDKNEVTHLSIGENTEIRLESIKVFSDLKQLSITSNKIKDISSLASILSLEQLFLGGNKIIDIAPLSNLKNLKELAIWGDPINDHSPISSLLNLEQLYCQFSNIYSIDFVQKLKKMKILYADNNKINDINPLRFLNKLHTITLSRNLINDISPLEYLPNLKSIDLSENLIKVIPKNVAEKLILHNENNQDYIQDREGLNSSKNPLEFPPSSVIELGVETINNYYETSEQFGHAPLSEGRIIFIGDGSAGKSSLIERVLYDTFSLGKSQTNGVKIEQWRLPHIDGRELSFHIWDFGGQEIQHAVHKFFFTEGCLYVLVLDNRKEEEPEYWLQQVESLGGSAPVLVVFNKQDDNAIEIADRKFLKEKYPNIVGFYNTSCMNGLGINTFRENLKIQVMDLRTVEEQFPNNWFRIKTAIEECTSGEQHYLTYNVYKDICNKNNAETINTQKLLLRYFTTIGAITWFGDTYLNFLHVLSPAWITQGVYKIITSKKTADFFGHINIKDFKLLLHPVVEGDYLYEESHYGYILSMMKKFDLCYTADDENLLLPSAFGKVPKIEYSEFRGDQIRTYILQFKDYMPMALMHRFVAKKLSDVYDDNYWYSGIVIRDNKTNSLAMVQADKEAKRIYVRIKGEAKLGVWEHIRREFTSICSNYANINYFELIALDEKSENTVNYEDLLSHIKAGKSVYFHPRQQKDYNVGYLMGLFENKENTIEKFKSGNVQLQEYDYKKSEKNIPFIVNILNNNSPTVNTQVNTQINIDIDLQSVNNVSSDVKGEATYLSEALESLSESNKALSDALVKIIQFADDAKAARNTGDVKAKGWGRKLKSVIQTLAESSEQVKKIDEGSGSLKTLLKSLKDLTSQFSLKDVTDLLENIL